MTQHSWQRLTWLKALGCPMTKLPTSETSVLACGSGSASPKLLSFFLPFLLPYLGKVHKSRLGVDEERRKSWSVPFNLSHLLTEKPASVGPSAYKALVFHVEPNIVPFVQESWSGGNAEVGCALSLL